MGGLYLPKSYREQREQREAQMEMDKFARSRPDFEDSRTLEARLRFRDDRMRVVWAHQGPHMNRWVVVRMGDDGMPHVVRVIRNDDGSYARPDPGLAETFIDTWSREGDALLKRIEAAEEKRRRDAAAAEDEKWGEVAERVAERISHHVGIKDRAFIEKGLL